MCAGLLASLRGWGHEAPPHSRLPLISQGWNLGKAGGQPAEKLNFLVSPWMVQFVRFQQELRGPPPLSPWQPGRLYSSSSRSPPKTDALSRRRKREVGRVAGDITGPPCGPGRRPSDCVYMGDQADKRTEAECETAGVHGFSTTLTSHCWGHLPCELVAQRVSLTCCSHGP